jgi:hypothetical protein
MMINNAAGSGGNQEDFIPEENNQGKSLPNYFVDNDEGHYEEEYNNDEDGTSGGNAKYSRDHEFRRGFDHNEGNNTEADDRVIQGNERRGRQKLSKKLRQQNKNTQETSRDSDNEYEEEEKNPGVNSSSGIQSQQYKKGKGKQSQPFGRQSEGPSSNQYNSRHDPRSGNDGYVQSMGSGHASQANQRHRQADPRQTYPTGDSGYNPNKQSRNRKDQKLSAESGGTDFNQNQSTANQMEDFKSPTVSQNYQYDPSSQNSQSNSHQRTPTRNVPRLNIGQRPASPDQNERNFQNLSLGQNYEEDVLLGEHEISTPRRQEQLENESKKTSGASTPSRDGADTPTRKNFNDQQTMNTGFIHDLTATNANRKYPIDRMSSQNSEGRGRSNNTYPQMNFDNSDI